MILQVQGEIRERSTKGKGGRWRIGMVGERETDKDRDKHTEIDTERNTQRETHRDRQITERTLPPENKSEALVFHT